MAISTIGYPGTVNSVQAAKRSAHVGTLTPVVTGGPDSFKCEANPAAPLTATVFPGTAQGFDLYDTNPDTLSVQFDPLTTGVRWDVIVLRRDWQALSGAGQSSVVKITNNLPTTEALPNSMQNTPGVLTDQLLYRARITAGQTVPFLVDARARASKVIQVPNLLSIPFPEIGMAAELPNGARYRYLLDSSNNPAWIRSTGGATKLTGSDVWNSETGWTGTNQTIQAIVDETSVHLSLELRRSGGRILSSPTGSITDQKIGAVKPGLLPTAGVKEPFSFIYYGGGESTSYGSFGGFGELRPDGGLWMMMLSPNAAINTRPASLTAPDYSFRMHLTYAKAGL